VNYTRQDFSFELPENLIAQQPTTERTQSRLLVMAEDGKVVDKKFTDLLSYLQPEDCLIFNNTKVIPARLFGNKLSGAKIELLIERVLDELTILTHIRSSRSPKVGAVLLIENAFKIEIIGRKESLFVVKIQQDKLMCKSALDLIETYGHMPLPPYISRTDELADKQRYQTVYAESSGAVAAPTAGLHFDLGFIEQIKQQGTKIGFVTLHIGAGTFRPVQVDNIVEHKMHAEIIEVLDETVQLIKQTKLNGGRVIAVGTTSVRSLESAFRFGSNQELQAYQGETDIFITPGVEFKVVDILLTNFHLPESTLIMLVSSLAGYDRTMQAYKYAVSQQYRFFSYGDAMLVFPPQKKNI
jgi:S-adenosylmethionine:tRNA ribosyltransferase-isomerase